MQRNCAECGQPFEALKANAILCGPTCRKRAERRRQREAKGESRGAVVQLVASRRSSKPEPVEPVVLPASLEAAVVRELGAQAATPQGMSAVLLARRIDVGDEPSGSAYAALHRQLVATLAPLLEAQPDRTEVDVVADGAKDMGDALRALG